MNILLLGSGGREHALAWKMAASPLTDRLFCASGNAGIAQEAECIALDLAEHVAIIAFCRANRIDFVVVGPEAPLCAGIVDDLEAAGIKAFGPSRVAARLEGSKGFTKDLCRSAGIPTAAYERFRTADEAKAFLQHVQAPGIHLFQPGGLESPLATQYGIMFLPHLVLVDKDGKVLSRSVQQVSSLDAELKRRLK